MSPWTVITALIFGGFVVLLVAPTLHRRSNARSRESAESKRIKRAAALRDSKVGTSREFEVAREAVNVRDRLLLRGVRSEVVAENGTATLIYEAVHDGIVQSVIDELETG